MRDLICATLTCLARSLHPLVRPCHYHNQRCLFLHDVFQSSEEYEDFAIDALGAVNKTMRLFVLYNYLNKKVEECKFRVRTVWSKV